MQWNFKIISAICVAFAALTGCNDSIDEDIAPRQLVVEGYIDSDGYPSVFLTYSVTANDYDRPMSDNLVRWGKVTISDGDTSIILTGAPNNNSFPPYHYRTFEMVGTPGKHYSIKAEFRNDVATASAEMLNPVAINSVDFEPIADSDSLCATFVNFTAPSDTPAYFVVFTRSITANTPFQPCMLGALEITIPSDKCRLQVYKAKSDFSPSDEDFVPHFKRGEDIQVKLSRVTKEIYDFWLAFSNESTFGNSQFINKSANLPSNVTRGFGIWSVQASSSIAATVK